jgi:hypothetical protein
MPDVDLDPGEYHERKPKGWRRKLPWRHPQDTKLPMVLFFLSLGALVWVFLHRHEVTAEELFVGTVTAGLIGGAQFILWLGRD